MVVKLALYAVDCVGLAVVAIEIRGSAAAPESAVGRKRPFGVAAQFDAMMAATGQEFEFEFGAAISSAYDNMVGTTTQ